MPPLVEDRDDAEEEGEVNNEMEEETVVVATESISKGQMVRNS